MRWDVRVRPQLVLLGVALALTLPLLASLAGSDVMRAWITPLGRAMDHRRFREATGYTALACILVQGALSARKRTRLPLGGSYPSWRSVHMLLGVGLFAGVLVHTGGRWGANLNGWLLGAFLLVSFTALVGKVFEARAVSRLAQRVSGFEGSRRRRAIVGMATLFAFAARGAARSVVAADGGAAAVERVWIERAAPARARRPIPLGRLRTWWLNAHVLAVAALMVLIAFHVLSAYYF